MSEMLLLRYAVKGLTRNHSLGLFKARFRTFWRAFICRHKEMERIGATFHPGVSIVVCKNCRITVER